MPTQKLPRPHVFTPPDLTIVTLDDFGRRVKKPLVGRYEVVVVGRAPNVNGFFPDILLTPKDVRGVTRVDYVHVERATSDGPCIAYGEGTAFLHTPDVFSEPFGVSLATVRAVTDLIRKHQPVNADNLGIRILRYLADVGDNYELEEGEQQILERAIDKLEETIAKCQSSK